MPISSIGNLCLLPEYANRSKKDKTIYEDSDYLKKSNMTIEQIESKYSFTSKSDLQWITDMSSSQDEFTKAYMGFIKTHFENMKRVLRIHFDQI